LQTQKTLLDRIALLPWLENSEDDSLRGSTPLCGASDREELRDTRIGDDFLVHLLLKRAHLLRRRAFLGDENAPRKTAVSRRKQRERQVGKEKPKPDDADEQDRRGQPRPVHESIKRATVGRDQIGR